MPNIEGGMRTRIAEFLPDALASALTSYQLFLQREHAEDPKNFKAHHDACKVAIAHVELLIKLAQWADLPSAQVEDESHQKMLAAMIQNAQSELAQYKKREETDA